MRCTLLSTVVTTLAMSGPALAALPNGVASGELTDQSVLLWTRSDTAGSVQFEVATDAAFTNIVGNSNVVVGNPLQPVKSSFAGLMPNTTYYYRATDAAAAQTSGQFTTAAAAGTMAGLRFGVSGDWRGELAPYPAVNNVPGRELNFFVGLGDTVYADVPSNVNGGSSQAMTLDEYRNKHDEVYRQTGGVNSWAQVRASTAFFATIDDHEVTNDFAGGADPASDPRFAFTTESYINETTLYNNGLDAFEEYNPIDPQTYAVTGDPLTDGKVKLFRSFRFGDDAQFILTDARSFRDEGLANVSNPLDPVDRWRWATSTAKAC